MSVRAEDLATAESKLGIVLPEDYRGTLMASDGLVEVMPSAYLQLWSLTDVVRVNRNDAYGLAESRPGLLHIGTATRIIEELREAAPDWRPDDPAAAHS